MFQFVITDPTFVTASPCFNLDEEKILIPLSQIITGRGIPI